MFNFRPATCRYCRSAIEQPKMGRPRKTCAAPVCQREAEAERKRRLRRRKAGLGPGMISREPQPRGGRDPLGRRAARQVALAVFPHVQPTTEELVSLEVAMRLGVDRYSLRVGKAGKIAKLPRDLSKTDRLVLQALAARNHEAMPEVVRVQRKYGMGEAIVGELPEPFVRRGPRRTGRSPGHIELPLPDKPKLIDW